MLIILQVLLILWAGLIGWGLGYCIYTAIENYRLEKRLHKQLLLQLQRDNEMLEKLLENIRKETK